MKMTPLRAIKLHFLECSGGQLKEVKECPITDCPLYEFRLGKKLKQDEEKKTA